MLLISISLCQHLFFKTRKGTFPDMGAAFRLKKVWGTNGPRPFSFGVCATKKIPATSAGRKAQNVKSPTVRDLLTAGLEIVNTLDADAVSLLRKKLVATASRREGACNRTGEPSVTFCERGGARERADGLFFCQRQKNKPEQSVLCSDVARRRRFELPAF